MRRVDYLVWSKPACPMCDTLVGQMEAKGLSFNKLDVTEEQHSDKLDEIKQLGHRSVPILQYVETGEMVGGQIAIGKCMRGEL